MKNYATGPRNSQWKGGKTIASNGYRLLRVGVSHHLADCRGYAYEHRVVAERKIGRRLNPGEEVHHINGDKLDNRPDNLEAVASRHHHARRHSKRRDLRAPDEPNTTVSCACGCGNEFMKYDGEGRPRRFVSGHNPYRNAN